jgi:dUTP pyrophosphatase
MIVKFKRLHPEAKAPKRGTKQSTGLDLFAIRSVRIQPGEGEVIGTGIAIEPSHSYGVDIQIRSRSGLASQGICVANSPATIDADYRGELKVILWNHSRDPYTILKHDRIAQLVVSHRFLVELQEETNELSDTERGKGGFGSTGR